MTHSWANTWTARAEPAEGVRSGTRFILVGTHHKTGTHWMRGVFRSVAAALRDDREDARIIFADHSVFDAAVLATDFRGLHVIRDPRDVVISGLHFHKVALQKNEPWLHKPRAAFGGLSYQQRLNSLLPDDQFTFEAEHCARQSVHDMVSWRYTDPRFHEARYEDLVLDATGERFAAILHFLRLPRAIVQQGVTAFLKTGLFPGRAVLRNHPHIRSGQPAQWRSEFTRRQGKQFVELMGDSLLTLGYETNHSWVDRLRD